MSPPRGPQRPRTPALQEAWDAMQAQGIPIEGYRAFRQHRENAKKRGIEFLFTLPEWWAWWQEDGRWEERGNRADDLVMARYGDQGPYRPDNVYCCTSRRNTKDIGGDRLSATWKAKMLDPGVEWHLKQRGDGHPKSKPVITPKGRFGSAALAGEAHGYTRQHARFLASQNKRGWRWETPVGSPD